jgi:CBS domain-containing protein
VETSAISYRVADFLKQYPPFSAIAEHDLVALADHGRVRFFPAGEFIAWQGEPHKAHVFVIQQGTVSLWDDGGAGSQLRDVRGPGDLIGVERFHGAPSCVYTARATTDVVVYGFPVDDFAGLLDRYPYASRFVDTLGTVASDFQRADEPTDPTRRFLHEVAGPQQTCSGRETVADAARRMLARGAGAVAVVADDASLKGLVTPDVVLRWLAAGTLAAERTLSEMALLVPPVLGPGASLVDGALAMADAGVGAVALTADGATAAPLLTVVTDRDLTRGFGDHPAAILPDIASAADLPALRTLNQRARRCALTYLTSATSTDWLTRFLTRVDDAILTRVLALTAPEAARVCWCTFGISGRAESIVARIPQLLVIHPDDADVPAVTAEYAAVVAALSECGFLPASDTSPAADRLVASAGEWTRRYDAWIRTPVIAGLQRNRALLDLRVVSGARRFGDAIRSTVYAAVDRDIVQIMAHDCLADLPPLTFYEDAVVEQSGEMTTVFRLERSALQPLVDLGRVFGMAARQAIGTSTHDRFAAARRLLPAHEAIFREAADALRIVLWQQARVGIRQGTTGAELPPSVLSRHDRHLLKSAFPVIQQLIEFAADSAWLTAL